jgi:hypothetical protein
MNYLVTAISAQCGCVTFLVVQDPPGSKKNATLINKRKYKIIFIHSAIQDVWLKEREVIILEITLLKPNEPICTELRLDGQREEFWTWQEKEIISLQGFKFCSSTLSTITAVTELP